MNLGELFSKREFSVNFNNKNFNYKFSKIDINPHIIGISGNSGSGKSILLYFLAGFLSDKLNDNTAYSDSNSYFLFPKILDNFDIYDDRFIYFFSCLFDEKLIYFSDMLVQECSFGQQIRFKLIRLFLSGKTKLLLDEPTNGLDSISREKVINVLHNNFKDSFILIATHDSDILNICDTIIKI